MSFKQTKDTESRKNQNLRVEKTSHLKNEIVNNFSHVEAVDAFRMDIKEDSKSMENQNSEIAFYSRMKTENNFIPRDAIGLAIKDDSEIAASESSGNANLQLKIACSYSLADSYSSFRSDLGMEEDQIHPVTETGSDLYPPLESAGYTKHETRWSPGMRADVKEETLSESSVTLNPHLNVASHYQNKGGNSLIPEDPLGTNIQDGKVTKPNEPPFSCDRCNYKTLDCAKLAQHVRKHTKKIFRCTKCPYQTSYQATFKRHTSEPCENQRRYPCDQCEYQTNNSSYLKIHRRMHSGNKTFSCSVCTYKTCYSNGLTVHMRKHTGERPYRCDRCDYRAAVIGVLKNHVEKVHEEKSAKEVERPFWCTVCPSKFASNYALRKHMMTHTGERPFSCVVCHSRFTQRGTLVKHLRTHSGEKPYHCEHCEYKSACTKTLKNHVLRVHPTLSVVEGRLSELLGADGSSDSGTLDNQSAQ